MLNQIKLLTKLVFITNPKFSTVEEMKEFIIENKPKTSMKVLNNVLNQNLN